MESINTHCPICGQENNCMARKEESGNCWCNEVEFPKGIFDLVPPEDRRKKCICHTCVTNYQE